MQVKLLLRALQGLIGYGAKQAGINAVEGALVSAGATPFQHAAQTGSFNAPAEAYLSNAAGGAVLGGALGGVLGGYQGHLQQIGHTAAAPNPMTTPPPYTDPTGQMDILSGVPVGRPAPMSPDFSFTHPIRSQPEGPYTDFTEGPQQQDLFNRPVAPPQGPFGGGMTAEITSPDIPTPAQSITPNQGIPPQTVSLRTATLSDVKLWQSQGYVYVGKGPDGFGMMARGDVAPMYTPPQQPPAPVNRPEVPSAMGANEVPATDVVTIPTAKIDRNPGIITQLEEGGYKLVEKRPDGMSLFRRFMMMRKVHSIHNRCGLILKRLLGRDPTPEEVDRGMARQPVEGETRGRVAQFEQPDLTFPFDNQDLLNQYLTLSERLDTWPGGVERRPDLVDNADRMQAELIRRGWNPQTGQFPTTAADTTPYSDKLGYSQRPVSDPTRPSDDFEYAQPLSTEEEAALIEDGHLLPENWNKTLEQLEAEGALAPGGRYDPIRNYMGEAVEGIDQPRIPETGQQELPLMGRPRIQTAEEQRAFNRQQDIRALRAQQLLGENWGETRQPEQLSMEGQMKDAEIQAVLQREDATPPEMRDLSEFGPDRLYTQTDPQAIASQGRPEPGRRNETLDSLGFKTTDQVKPLDLSEQIAKGLPPDTPQEMRVPGVREGKGGLENVALGGADPRVWDVVGSSLYARKRPVTTVKELLQNAWDEHKEIGVKEPVRVLIDNAANSPIGGQTGRSITVRDRGRGLAPENIYTYLTNLGSTGKAGVESAAGGFGFAKAAPFTGGKFTRVRSVVDMPDGTRMMYTFEGRPSELKNQARGVPLNAIQVSKKIPTGLEVYTFYDADIPGFYNTANWAKNMAQRSPSVETPTKIADAYGANAKEARAWLDESPENPITEYNYLANNNVKEYSPAPVPTLMDTIKTPGADVNIHYDIPPGSEASEAELHLTNKGMYQGSQTYNYGGITPNVPRSIVADIIATVEEGHESYPFSANREQLNDDITGAIKKWADDNIITGVTQKRIAAIQGMYDNIGPLHPISRATRLDYLDEGNLLTPDELDAIVNHPKMVRGLQTLESIHKRMLEVADTLGWTPQTYGAKWTKPSERLKKFGLLFKASDAKGTVMGIHVPRPDDMENSAILFNLMEHLNEATTHETPIDKLTAEIVVTLAHEQAHIPGGGHDKGHSYRDADLRTAFGAKNTVNWLNELEGAFGDGKGGISQEISDLLQIYNGSRQRKTSGPDALLATGITSTRQPNTQGRTSGDTGSTGRGEAQSKPLEMWESIKGKTGWGQGATKGGKQDPNETNWLREALAVPSAATTTGDFSAPGRQGLSMILTPQFWKAGAAMFKGISPEGFKQIDADLRNKPIFQKKVDLETGQVSKKSFAEEIGMKLFIQLVKLVPELRLQLVDG